MSAPPSRPGRAATRRQSIADLARAESPAPVIRRWWAEAIRGEEPLPPGAMTLVTADAAGRPSARVVICQQLDESPLGVRFLTRAGSRKTRDIEANQSGAALFYWPRAGRQVRLEGLIEALDAEETSALVLGLPLWKQLGARRVRPQSTPGPAGGGPERMARAAGPGCVGYRLCATWIELWESRPLGGHASRRWARPPGGSPEQLEAVP